MSIIDRLLRRKAAKPENGMLPMASYLSPITRYFHSMGRDRKYIQLYTGWVHACVSTIGDSIGNIELRLMRTTSEGTEEVKDHQIKQMLDKVNPYMTKFDLFSSTQSFIELDGNAFWYIIKDNAGKPAAVWPLRPDMVSVIPSKDQFIAYYEYTVGAEKFKISPKDIVHFKSFNPMNPYRGMGTVEASIAAIDADNFSRQWNAAFFANSARPDAVLQYDGNLTRDEEERLRSSWRDMHGGPDKAHGVGILWGGVKYEPVSVSQKEMDFVEQRRFSRDEILAMFRVPKTAIGIVEDVNYASAITTNYVFASRCIKPKMQKIVDTLNEFLIPLFGDENLYLDFVDPVPENIDEKLKVYQAGLQYGFMSVNEVRTREGLPPVTNGDAVMTDFSKIPLGSPIEPTKAIGLLPSGKPKSLAESIRLLAKDISDTVKTAYADYMSVQEFEERGLKRHKSVMERSKTFEQEMKERMLAFFKEQEARVFEAMAEELKPKKGHGKKAKGDVFDEEAEKDALVQEFSKFFKTVFLVEGEAALEENGIDEVVDLQSERMRKLLKAKTEKFAGGVTKTTSEKVRTAIANGLAAGEGLDDIEKRIRQAGTFDAARSELIARTEVIRTQNLASVEAWKESEVVVKKIWYTAEFERVCVFCDAMHGKPVDVDEVFFKRGETLVVDDEMLDLDYESVGGPPLHPDCRCTLLPVVEKTKQARPKQSITDTKQLLNLYHRTNDVLEAYERNIKGEPTTDKG